MIFLHHTEEQQVFAETRLIFEQQHEALMQVAKEVGRSLYTS